MKAHMKTHENPSSKFNIALYSPLTDAEENNEMEEHDEELGEQMSVEENSTILS